MSSRDDWEYALGRATLRSCGWEVQHKLWGAAALAIWERAGIRARARPCSTYRLRSGPHELRSGGRRDDEGASHRRRRVRAFHRASEVAAGSARATRRSRCPRRRRSAAGASEPASAGTPPIKRWALCSSRTRRPSSPARRIARSSPAACSRSRTTCTTKAPCSRRKASRAGAPSASPRDGVEGPRRRHGGRTAPAHAPPEARPDTSSRSHPCTRVARPGFLSSGPWPDDLLRRDVRPEAGRRRKDDARRVRRPGRGLDAPLERSGRVLLLAAHGDIIAVSGERGRTAPEITADRCLSRSRNRLNDRRNRTGREHGPDRPQRQIR